MPSYARAKRVNRNRFASDIEEDEVMQDLIQNGPAENGDEDEEITIVVPTVKKEKGKTVDKGKRKQVEEDNSDGHVEGEDTGDESDDDDNARIDVTNFRDQPFGRTELTKIKGLASDWEGLDKKIQQSWGGVRQVAVAMAEVAEDEQGQKSLDELDRAMRELIDMSAEMNVHRKALDEIYQKVAQGEQINDAMDGYQDMVKAMAREYSQKTSRQKYAKHEQYIKFKENVFEVLHPDRPMPPVTELVAREEGDGSDDDDDLEVGGVTQDYKCPLSLTPFTDPLTSTVCGHSFSSEAIRSYFKGSRIKKCPASGCRQSFQLSDCKPDKELARKVRIWMRRKQRNDDDSDAEEVVE